MGATVPVKGDAIHLWVIAPSLALRTGLRAMLASDERLVVSGEAGALMTLSMSAAGCDVILIDEDTLSGDPMDEPGSYDRGQPDLSRLRSTLEGNLPGVEVYPAVLLLGDNPGIVNELIDLPLRAWGVLPADSTAEELIAAVHALYEGLIVAAPHLFKSGLKAAGLKFQIHDSLAGSSDLRSPNLQPAILNLKPVTIPLTPRETEVLQLLAQGLANKQIALALGISEHTIKFHVSSIYAKLGVGNRTEAVRVGARQGLILL